MANGFTCNVSFLKVKKNYYDCGGVKEIIRHQYLTA